MNRRSKRPHPSVARKAEDLGDLLRCLLRVVESESREYTASETSDFRGEYADRYLDFLDLVGREYGPTLDLVEALIEFLVEEARVEEIEFFVEEWYQEQRGGPE